MHISHRNIIFINFIVLYIRSQHYITRAYVLFSFLFLIPFVLSPDKLGYHSLLRRDAQVENIVLFKKIRTIHMF